MKDIRGLSKGLLLCVCLSVLSVPAAHAQGLFAGTAEETTDAPPFDDNVADVPVDGGLSLLLAAGALYGGRRIRRMQSARPRRIK